MIRKISGSYMQGNSYFPFAGVIYINEHGHFTGNLTEENRPENSQKSTIEGRITEDEMVFYKKYFNLGPTKEHLTYILCNKMNNKEFEGSWKATTEAVSFHDNSAKVIDYGRATISIGERICEICQTEEAFAKNKEFD